MIGNNSTTNVEWMSFQTYTLMNYLIQCVEAVLIVVGNSLTLIAVKKTKSLNRIPTNVFIVSLATSDGIIGLLIPILISVKLLDSDQIWIGTTCLLHGPYFSMFSISLLTLLAIAIDRYHAVVNPLVYRQRMTLRKARIITVVIWIMMFGIITGSTCYFGIYNNVIQLKTRVLGLLFPKLLMTIVKQLLILSPVLGNVVIYIIIYKNLKSKNKVGPSGNNHECCQNTSSKATKSYVRMMVLVLAYLITACIPYYIIDGIVKQKNSNSPSWLVYLLDVSIILFYSNSFMNPVIYSWKNRHFREAYKTIMICEQSFGGTREIRRISTRIDTSV